ncbi:AfsR/SARP family transcriptional regulator, partial [Amycolatopsis mediterranei]|uniref:AfsR/SARP family transcriptional regulator n=1 Tax=Amycolatopsis mediterranei TaxID=33910 RepID=UPI00331747B1
MWTDDPAGGTAQGQERPEFRVLGPFEVLVHGRPLDLGGPRIRTLLALLIANAGRVISVDTMASALWDVDATPGTPRTVRTYMSRLRRSLAPGAALGGGDLIETRAAGYALRAESRAYVGIRDRVLARGEPDGHRCRRVARLR